MVWKTAWYLNPTTMDSFSLGMFSYMYLSIEDLYGLMKYLSCFCYPKSNSPENPCNRVHNNIYI